ncbi:IclR family transcriptional regulator [Sulfoacidibacillus thermotolerans]|uniref:Glycerol operon regulatory protein n=1 Tax=Sulfoacidibacillus thermotolerans TaxID=1765684 RepID=A0A2U3DBW3_SULT2|nr:IclR family transcriptional regulator [Sulfoacidibacillus thermotolerans]PWI58766.1 IclR family transcriptional regulator [Sulfoacidibacillus thermotolerans]
MEDYTVKSVEKACLLLDVVSLYPEGIGITELAEQVDMYKSTVHRLLGTLMKRGYIQQDVHSGKYKLGYKLLDLGMKMLSSLDLRKEAAPLLQELAHQTNEVVHLGVLDHGDIVYIDKVESNQTVRMHSRVGKRVPVHAVGLGKAILAAFEDREVEQLIHLYGLPAVTPKTITDRHQLMAILAEVREQGYAFDIEENELGICCVASPIYDNNHKVVAACSVSGPNHRMALTRLKELAPIVRQTAKEISLRLGDRPSSFL